MKFQIVLLIATLTFAQCRKLQVPLDKKANIDFINMEGGGLARQPAKQPPSPTPQPAKPHVQTPIQSPVKPAVVTTLKPQVPNVAPAKPNQPQPSAPSKSVTTPGPGTVKQLVTFYDSQGKQSVIRPYSYSQAVKQG